MNFREKRYFRVFFIQFQTKRRALGLPQGSLFYYFSYLQILFYAGSGNVPAGSTTGFVHATTLTRSVKTASAGT